MNHLKYLLLLPVMSISISVLAQDPITAERERRAHADSVARVEQRADNLSDLKSERDESQAKANEAQKLERNATAAAKESKDAYRAEQKAQKARNKADKQARKAAKARAKSDKD